jgi:hypothetical protein
VDKLVTAQCVTDDPAPLLQAAGDVLALADVLRPNATAQPFTTEAEQEIWEILGELKACYGRDRGQIQTAHNIQASQEADDVGYQEMAHVSIAAGGRQFRLDQLHRPHRVVLARDEQEPGEVGDVGGDPAEGLPLGLHQGQDDDHRYRPRAHQGKLPGIVGRPGPRTARPRNGGGRLPGQPAIIAQPPVTGGAGDAWPPPAAETSRCRLLVSVLTATFNRRATFLPQRLDSVRHQVGDGFTHEHIVVDDCSADGTWDYLQQAAREDPRVKPVRTDDGARAELRARRGNRGS